MGFHSWLRFLCFWVGFSALISISGVSGAQCSEERSKQPQGGQILMTLANIKTFAQCCDYCALVKDCKTFLYARIAEDCQLWNSTLLKESYSFDWSSGNVLPDGWTPPPNIPTTTPRTPDCPANNMDTSVQKPDTQNCGKYFRCILGTWYPQNCTADTWYDYRELRCRMENGYCYPGSIVPTYPPSTTTETVNITTTTGRPITTEFPNPCQPTGIYNVSHPTDCSRYVRCTQGVPVSQSCGNGGLFDAVSGVCTAAELAACFINATTTVRPSTLAPTTTTTRATTTVPISTSTKKPEECPNTGIVNIPHPSDCRKYVRCVQGINAGAFSCPSLQKFDNRTRACVAEANAQCWNEM